VGEKARTTMLCHELEDIFSREPDSALPPSAAEHLETCTVCRALAADLKAIRLASLELPAEEDAPTRVWARIRLELEAEGLIREPRLEEERGSAANWFFFQRPAFAGAVLALLILAAGLVGVRRTRTGTNLAADLNPVSLPASDDQEASLTSTEAGIESLQQVDPQVQAVFKRDLALVDDAISKCEKSVREQPGNDLAREYLYDAYQQKAQLLAVAMDRGTLGGR